MAAAPTEPSAVGYLPVAPPALVRRPLVLQHVEPASPARRRVGPSAGQVRVRSSYSDEWVRSCLRLASDRCRPRRPLLRCRCASGGCPSAAGVRPPGFGGPPPAIAWPPGPPRASSERPAPPPRDRG